MANYEPDNTATTHEGKPGKHSGLTWALAAGLGIALCGVGYLISRANSLEDHIAQMQNATQDQMSKQSEATTALLDQRLRAMGSDVQSANDTASAAVKQARAEVQRQSAQLGKRMDEQQQQVSGELTELKGATSTANSKLDEVSADVNGVKTDVTGVKSDVTDVKT
jgi:hypothetical protein